MLSLAIILALNTVVALYYYLRVIKFVFLHEPAKESALTPDSVVKVTLGMLALMLIFLGVCPTNILNWVGILLHL